MNRFIKLARVMNLLKANASTPKSPIEMRRDDGMNIPAKIARRADTG